MISVEGLCVTFGVKPLFRDVSFVVNERDRIALVGKNGAGKSTLLKILKGLQQPTNGAVSYTHLDVYKRQVLHSRIQFVDIKIEDCIATVKAGSGVIWDDLVAACVEQKAYGLENLSLIPGTVGAAAVQNIGAYGCEVKDFIQAITAVEIATGHEVTFTNADCQYAYRYSKFKGEWKNKYVIISVELKFNCTYSPHLDYGNIQFELQRKGIEHPTPQQLRDTIIAIRQTKLPDPKIQGNAGSFFMNPIVCMQQYQALAVRYPKMPHYQIDGLSVKIPAGWLIEQCGWKGKTLGRAGVHDKQALVLVNRGGASGSDIERDVYKRQGVLCVLYLLMLVFARAYRSDACLV